MIKICGNNNNMNKRLDHFKTFIVELLWNITYMFSMLEIYTKTFLVVANDVYKICDDWVFSQIVIDYSDVGDETKIINNSLIQTRATFYNNGKKIHEKTITKTSLDLCYNDIYSDISNINTTNSYDLVVYEYDAKHAIYVKDNTNNFITANTDNNVISECENDYISIVLEYNGKSYDIDLKTDKYNFCVKFNPITKMFLYYYLLNVLKADNICSFDTFTYSLEIIDKDVNMYTITHDDVMLLGQNYTTSKKND